MPLEMAPVNGLGRRVILRPRNCTRKRSVFPVTTAGRSGDILYIMYNS